MFSQHPPDKSILSCVSCTCQLHVKWWEVIRKIAYPGWARMPRWSSPILWGLFKNDSAVIGCSFHSTNMPKDRESRRDLTIAESGGYWVIWRIWSFLTKSNQRTSRILRRHHWSAVSIRRASAYV